MTYERDTSKDVLTILLSSSEPDAAGSSTECVIKWSNSYSVFHERLKLGYNVIVR